MNKFNQSKIQKLFMCSLVALVASTNGAKCGGGNGKSKAKVVAEVVEGIWEAGDHRKPATWASQSKHRTPNEWMNQKDHRSPIEWVCGTTSRNSPNAKK
jgi:hypothetical protein